MREPRDDSADEVKNQISNMTEAIFDVVTKDKKEKHVAEDVRNAAVHEHRSEQRQVNRNRSRLQSRHLDALAGELLDGYWTGDDVPAGDDLTRNRRVGVGELVVTAETLKKHKHEHVNRDEHIVNERRGVAAPVIVAYWKKHDSVIASNVLTSYIRSVLFFSRWMSVT